MYENTTEAGEVTKPMANAPTNILLIVTDYFSKQPKLEPLCNSLKAGNILEINRGKFSQHEHENLLEKYACKQFR